MVLKEMYGPERDMCNGEDFRDDVEGWTRLCEYRGFAKYLTLLK